LRRRPGLPLTATAVPPVTITVTVTVTAAVTATTGIAGGQAG
jgi:hypothetical protein